MQKVQFHRVFVVLLIICMGMSTTGCSKIKPDQYRIMFIPESQSSNFWNTAMEGFETAVAEYDASGTIRSPEFPGDYMEQAAIVDEAVLAGYNAIILSSNYNKALTNSIEDAIKQGVEVVVIDEEVVMEEVKVCIGTDNYQAGYEMGKTMAYDLNYEGEIGILTFRVSALNLQERIQGFTDALANYQDINIVSEKQILLESVDTRKAVKELLVSHPELKGIATFNKVTTMELGKELQSQEREDMVALGFDSNIQIVEYLEQGILDGTVVQNPFAMGYLGVQTAIELLEGERTKVEKINTGINVVTKENLFDPSIQMILFPFDSKEET